MMHLVAVVLLFASVDSRAESFDHSLFDRVLNTYVDAYGRVGYTTLKANRSELDDYIAELEAVSPKSHPARFSVRDEALAYWINAYNALTIKGVVDAYPVKSVKDIKILSGFFNRTWHTVGGESYTLNSIEHDIIRAEFGDPRIHAAINCASGGCPRLENRAFIASTLNERLDGAMRSFLNEERNVQIHIESKTVRLSKILSWFEDDFTQWFEQEHRVSDAGILDYVIGYLSPDRSKGVLPSFRVDYFDYDWSLNDQITDEDR